MKLLKLSLTVPQGAEPGQILINTDYGYYSSNLPWFVNEENRRTTMMKALGAVEFNPEIFTPQEQDWMVEEGWLTLERKHFSPEIIKKIGVDIYTTLFKSGKGQNILIGRLGELETNEQLHIQIQFDGHIDERGRLPDYPWELAYDQGGFLAERQATFSRFIAFNENIPNLPPVEQINVLLVSSKQGDSDPEIDLDSLNNKEQKAILKGLREAAAEGRKIIVKWKDNISFKGLGDYLTQISSEEAPHIIHFDGHGFFGKRCNQCQTIHKKLKATHCRNSECNAPLPSDPQGYLLFKPDDDYEQEVNYVSAKELSDLIKTSNLDLEKEPEKGVRLVVISACKSGMTLGSNSVFNGIAQQLIDKQIPAVVAMQYNITVEGATAFADRFYRALGNKKALTTAVNIGQAAMGREGNQWYRPVLYLRWKDNEGGQLFAQPKAEHEPPLDNNNCFIFPRGIPVEDFLGRSEFINSEFNNNEDSGILDGILKKEYKANATFIHGIGGVGKTELCKQYARKYKNKYPGGICWLTSDENKADAIGIQIKHHFEACFNSCSPNGALLDQVNFCWNNWRGKDRKDNVLVVVDNVIDYKSIENYLEIPIKEERFEVLINTLEPEYSSRYFNNFLVEGLNEEAALKLLELDIGKEIIEKKEDKAKGICKDLAGLPLALVLIGSYFRKYGIDLEKAHQAILRNKMRMPKEFVEAYAAISLSWEKLDDEDKYLGSLFGLFNKYPIPSNLIEKLLKSLGKNSEDLEYFKDETCNRLKDLRLISYEDGNTASEKKTYQIFAIIQVFLERKLNDLENDQVRNIKEKFGQLMLEEAQKISATPTREEKEAVKLSIPHIEKVANKIQDYFETSEEIIEIYLGLGRFDEGNGTYDTAEKWYGKYLDMVKERSLEKGFPPFVKAQNAFAYINLLQDKHRETRILYKKASITGEKWFNDNKLTKEEYKKEWMNVVQSRDGWGYLLCHIQSHPINPYPEQRKKRGEKLFDKAKGLLEDALRERKNCLGEKHPDIALSFDHLGFFYRECLVRNYKPNEDKTKKENWDEGKKYFVDSRDIRKENFKEKPHPLLAESYNNLGMFCLHQAACDEYSEKEKVLLLQESVDSLNEALKVYTNLNRKSHYEFARILLHLAEAYMDLDPGKIKKLCDRVINIGESIQKPSLQVEAYIRLVLFYKKEEDLENVKIYCRKGFALVKENESKKWMTEGEKKFFKNCVIPNGYEAAQNSSD